jgi:hypothetical protein
MGQIIPQIFKHGRRLPKHLRWPIQYSHLEACFLGRYEQDLRLHVQFWQKQTSGWRSFRRASTDHAQLLALDCDPEYRGWRTEEIDYRFVVRATVYAVSAEALQTSGLVKSRLRSVLMEQVRRHAPRRLPSDRWYYDLALSPKDRMLESVRVGWTGLRQEAEVRMRVPIQEEPPTTGEKA